jgi:hypothetical protein
MLLQVMCEIRIVVVQSYTHNTYIHTYILLHRTLYGETFFLSLNSSRWDRYVHVKDEFNER